MKRAKKYKIRKKIIACISNVLKVIASLAFLFPFYWMIATSLKTYKESIQSPPTLWPENLTLDSYISVFSKVNVWPYISNTLIILFWALVISTLIMVPTAYVFARYEFKGKALMFGFITMSFMIPGQVTFITKYIMFSKLELLGTLIPQISAFILNSFGIFMLRQTFMQVPDELVESAQLDEANELQIITKIMLPMAKSTFATVTVLQIISVWNAYFPASVYSINEATHPITMLVSKIRTVEEGIMHWPTIMAGNMILVIPVLIVFLLGSKKILASIGYRGTK